MEMLQLVLCLLTIFSLFMLVIMSFTNLRVTKRQLIFFMIPMVLLFAVLAFRFDYTANANNDLSRYIRDLTIMRSEGFFYEFNAAENYAIFYRVIAWFAKDLNDYHWYPFWVVLVEYLIYLYILATVTEKYKLSSLDVLISVAFELCMLPAIISFAAFRGTLAFSILALFICLHYVKQVNSKWHWLLIPICILTHTTTILPCIVLWISSKVKRSRLLTLLFLFVPMTFGLLQTVLSKINLEFTQVYAAKLLVYLGHPTNYDIEKSYYMIPWFAVLFLLQIYFSVIGKEKSSQLPCASFFLYYMALIFGMFFVMAELFLRLMYLMAMTFPIMLGNNNSLLREMDGKRGRMNNGVIRYVMLALALVALVLTRGGWMTQIYWFNSF